MFPGFDGKLPGEDFMFSAYPIFIALFIGMIYGVRCVHFKLNLIKLV